MSEPIIKINDVNKWFGDFQVLKNINLDVKPKQKIVVCGPSGSGKSTILKAILGIEEYSGKIFFENEVLKKDKLSDLRKKCQVVFQDPFSSLSPRMRVEEIIK